MLQIARASRHRPCRRRMKADRTFRLSIVRQETSRNLQLWHGTIEVALNAIVIESLREMTFPKLGL